MDPILVRARIVTSRTETLNCDISSLKNDTEIYHSMNRKFQGASYGYGYNKKMLSFLGGSFKFASNSEKASQPL